MRLLKFERVSVLVNGSLTKEFTISKGVEQGSPLSPFLYILAMEGLHVVVKVAMEKHIFLALHCQMGVPRY